MTKKKLTTKKKSYRLKTWHIVGLAGILIALPIAVLYTNKNNDTIYSHADTVQPVGQTSGWTMTFSDEFSGTSVDTTKWSYQSTAEGDWSSNPLGTGNSGNEQLEFDQPANCTITDGILSMIGKPDNITSQSGKHYNWSSCMLNTSPSYAFRYGYIEVRAQLPSPKGFWPALWTWEKSGVSAPGAAETDVFEFYSDNHTNLYQTNHNVSPAQQNVYKMPSDPTAAYHVYGADIEPTGTDWYVDGVKTYHTSTTSGGETNILLDNFVYSKIPPASGSTGTFYVDYVRAWQKDTTPTATTDPAVTTQPGDTATPLPTNLPTDVAPTNTPVPPTATKVPPTSTPVPSTTGVQVTNLSEQGTSRLSSARVDYTLKTTGSLVASSLVVAVRKGTANYDFASKSNVTLAGTQSFTVSKKFPTGTYSYWVAYYANGKWTNLSPTKTFTIR